MTITIGYWLIPIFIMIISYFVAYIATPSSRSDNLYTVGIGMLFDGMMGLFYFFIATIISLIAWIIYFAVT